jgi:phosphoribosylamine--glycine ligase
MNVLLIGSGGREHAFAWKLAQSNLLSKLYIAPGNAGSETCGENILIDITNFQAIRDFVLAADIKMVVVGPEEPLVNGIHDFFLADAALNKIPVIGPCKNGAMLEGSKDFSKGFMVRHGIPTARYQTFTKERQKEAFNFLESCIPPFVLKADGLAAGKGVLIIDNLDEAKKQLVHLFEHAPFGKASQKVVIEEFLSGMELSVFVLTDGVNYKILPEAKDYKRIGEGDTGLNTGGMGAVSPVGFADQAFMKKVEENIIIPTINGLQVENINYRGFIFIGIMNVSGYPYVIEYNCRMGDPETEVVIPRIKNDLLALFVATAEQKLNQINLEVDPAVSMAVMLVAGGYPEAYEKNKIITGLKNVSNALVFHAGTIKKDEKIVSNGGRVLAVQVMEKSIESARRRIYAELPKIEFEEMYYRKDIGSDLERLVEN